MCALWRNIVHCTVTPAQGFSSRLSRSRSSCSETISWPHGPHKVRSYIPGWCGHLDDRDLVSVMTRLFRRVQNRGQPHLLSLRSWSDLPPISVHLSMRQKLSPSSRHGDGARAVFPVHPYSCASPRDSVNSQTLTDFTDSEVQTLQAGQTFVAKSAVVEHIFRLCTTAGSSGRRFSGLLSYLRSHSAYSSAELLHFPTGPDSGDFRRMPIHSARAVEWKAIEPRRRHRVH